LLPHGATRRKARGGAIKIPAPLSPESRRSKTRAFRTKTCCLIPKLLHMRQFRFAVVQRYGAALPGSCPRLSRGRPRAFARRSPPSFFPAKGIGKNLGERARAAAVLSQASAGTLPFAPLDSIRSGAARYGRAGRAPFAFAPFGFSIKTIKNKKETRMRFHSSPPFLPSGAVRSGPAGRAPFAFGPFGFSTRTPKTIPPTPLRHPSCTRARILRARSRTYYA